MAEVAVEVGVAEDPLMEVKARKERKNVETREDLDGPPIFCGLPEGNHFPPYSIQGEYDDSYGISL